jgi:predicted alpha/beta superfamily hydrolase
MLFNFGFLQAQTITFRVEAPETTPARDTIYITGSHNQLGNWNPKKVPLQKKSSRMWETTLRFPANAHLEYKITRGSWQTEATNPDGTIPGNSLLEVTRDSVVNIHIPNWRDILYKVEGGITGTVKYHPRFRSKKLNYDRDLIVLLPPSYNERKQKRYPVIYMHDGQNVFDPSTAYIGVDWQIDEVADSLWRKGELAEFIVVGIYNSPDRMEEYARTAKGEAYMNFIIHVLKPFIDRTYRTLPDRQHTAVMGSSMGGLISFYLVWLHPEVFYQAACLSASFLWKNGDSLHMVKDDNGTKKDIRIYFDNGSIGGEGQMTPYYKMMRDLLVAKGFTLGEDLEYFYDEGADHSERAWAKRVWRPVKFMFGKSIAK